VLAPAAKCRNAQLSGAHGRSGCSSKRLSAFFARCTHQDRCAPARNDVQRYADYSVGRVVIDRAGRQSCHFVDQFVAGVVAQHVPRVCLREAFHEFPLRADEEVVRAHPGDFFAQPVYQGAARRPSSGLGSSCSWPTRTRCPSRPKQRVRFTREGSHVQSLSRPPLSRPDGVFALSQSSLRWH